MRALEPCLTGLPETSRKVLSLRAGLGTARTRSRRDVADMTGFTLQRVARVEAGAMRRLKRLARTTGCAAAVTTDAFAAAMGDAAGGPGLPGPGLAGPAIARSDFVRQTGSAARTPRIAVLSQRESSDANGDRDSAGGPGLGPTLPGVGPVSDGEVPVAVVIGLALAGVVLTALLHRRTRRRDSWDPSEPW